ncbi:hypothetical protein PNOK_0868100 [Pyrrhoderma noxium]|uniref:Uncharacterized protein n=1 Tax=Pyrrhoderma noxium TaxID=2282107 RepID=A0A286U891_9AGAM|nr:hypothetical protein PNOK_0868100 [Pyrrhoderma noxium]
MDAVLDKAIALRGVTGVLVLTPDSWLTIASRGALSSSDAKTIEELISWTEEGSTGSVPWEEGVGGRCLHFYRAATHTLILLRRSGPTPPKVHLDECSSWPPRAPRMRLGLSTISTVSAVSAISAGSTDQHTIKGFGVGSASMYTPSCSCSLAMDLEEAHRPSSWY